MTHQTWSKDCFIHQYGSARLQQHMEDSVMQDNHLNNHLHRSVACFLLLAFLVTPAAWAAQRMDRYYAHDTVEDRHGVIAPWYRGQNGQFDWRVRIAAETLKRYPWTKPGEAVAVGPHYFYNGTWLIDDEGTITIPELNDWNNGDQSQRVAFILSALVDYYRYTGDAAAIAMMKVTGDLLLDHCLTPENHPWPRFPVSVPVKGVPYGNCDTEGYIQTDIAAEVGLALLKAYQVVGEERWLEAARHWGDLFATYAGSGPDNTPWSRYANPEVVPWSDLMTGGVTYILFFLDELIRLGYTGPGDALVEARDTGVAYLNDTLLPRWTRVDLWGRNFWDWECPVQCEYVTTFPARYMMANPDRFPNWRNDVRNIMNLFLNHTTVAHSSRADVYSGAWAYPESAGCCMRSLWYPPMEVSTVYAEYGVRADSAWGREMARRQQMLATYGERERGIVEDNIDGGQIVAGAWFKITHPMALKHILGTMAWLPEVQGANRENHLMRASAVVRNVVYGAGEIRYETFDAPESTREVLRLAFEPESITADGLPLERRADLAANGYTVKPLPNGDCIVEIRHDGAREVVVSGPDPQQIAGEDTLDLEGEWTTRRDAGAQGGSLAVTVVAGAEARFRFTGNQVRLIGRFAPDGGMADVWIDGEKQPAPVDCWNPTARDRQVLYYRNGMENGEHELRLVARGSGNPVSQGMAVYVDAVQWSDATGNAGFGEGGGPTEAQRMVLGYTGREPIIDSLGNAWHNGIEFVVPLGDMQDSVAGSWWTEPRAGSIEGTPDPELYQHGVHGKSFWVNVTVGPGEYHVRLKLAETRDIEPILRAMNVSINGEQILKGLDIAATAGGLNRAVDLVFPGVHPQSGVISVRLDALPGGEAILQALEVSPGAGTPGAEPVCLTPDAIEAVMASRGRLGNPGFEEGCFTLVGGGGAYSRQNEYWTAKIVSSGICYVWAESAYVIHPNLGLPKFRSGNEALRTHTDGSGHTRVWQEATVRPDTRYKGSVWVHGFSQNGRGFGTHDTDSAGIVIEELDKAGNVTLAHPKAGITSATDDYVQVETVFTTGPGTHSIHFVLDTVIGCHYGDGHVSYDDCELVAAPGAGNGAP
jgi:hypothetical protein